jgi:predicted amidohydrolase
MYAQTFALLVVYANRVGFEDGVGFWGGSEIHDPAGA